MSALRNAGVRAAEDGGCYDLDMWTIAIYAHAASAYIPRLKKTRPDLAGLSASEPVNGTPVARSVVALALAKSSASSWRAFSEPVELADDCAFRGHLARLAMDQVNDLLGGHPLRLRAL
jgi:hypothetical protein